MNSKPPGPHVVVVFYVPEPGDEIKFEELLDVFGPLSESEAMTYANAINGKREPVGKVERAIVRRLAPRSMGPDPEQMT